MELLYLYVHNDNKSIKGCEYNTSFYAFIVIMNI